MNISFEHPKAFYLMILLLPSILYMISRYNGFVKAFSKKNRMRHSLPYYEKAKKSFVLRTILRVFAWICLVLALAGISWGSKAVPVQKNGKAVTFVFDVSYSMEASDGPGGKTRFESVENYANELLDHMHGVTVAAVIAKGTGIVAVPQTEDAEAIKALLPSLSPKLISSEGSSLGSGINAAVSSFPSQSSQANYIWMFTDGEETDNMLTSSLVQAVSYGIPVTIVGFGSERESEVLAGDGETKVKTALRSDSIKKIISDVDRRTSIQGKLKNTALLTYIDASEVGSANALLKQLSVSSNIGTMEGDSISYEIQSVSRHKLFITLAILLFAFSFLAGEFTMNHHKKLFSAISLSAVILMTFTGCSARFNDRMTILQGHLDWKQNNYQQAVAEFLEVMENAEERGDRETMDYALFGLASTYLRQNEEDASLARFEQIPADCSNSVRFAALYNSALIASSRGDYHQASRLFKLALLLDSTNIDAKINLELSLLQENVQTDVKEQELTPVTVNDEDGSMKNAIYSIIRENEENQWKNQQQNTESSALDY